MTTNSKKYVIIGAIVIILFMSTTSKAVSIIAIFEGKKLKAYQDQAGIWTVGFGSTFNIDENRKVKEGDTITEATALRWLKTITANLQDDIKKLVKVPVTQNQLDSLTSLAYNIGTTAFKNSTLLNELNAGKLKSEVGEQFMRWVYVMGVMNQGLVNRRRVERELFER